MRILTPRRGHCALLICLLAACNDSNPKSDAQVTPDSGMFRDLGASVDLLARADMGRDQSALDRGAADGPTADQRATDQRVADKGAPDAVPKPDSAPCPIGINDTIPAQLAITVDDNYKLYLNGQLVANVTNLWNSPLKHNLTLKRHPSQPNVLAIEGINTMRIDGTDRAVVAEARWTVGPTVHALPTDKTWKVLGTAAPSGWEQPAFNDTAWLAATELGAHGMAPYGNILSGLLASPPAITAKLLWSYNPDKAAATKPVTETNYFRKTFYLTAAGALSATPGTCP